MANLVTCESIGNALAEWLNNATPEQLAKFCELLSCPINLGGEGSGLTGSGTADDPLRIDLSEDNGNIIELRENGLFGKPKISAQGGNLIQEREDGIYYGQEAAPEVRNLYVDSQNGDDAADGTRAAPLKTMHEAFKRQRVQTRFTVHLYEGQVHPWRSSWGFWTDYGPELRPYGPKVDELAKLYPRGAGADTVYSVKTYPQPIFKLIPDGLVDLSGTTYNHPHMTEITGAIQWVFIGINFDLTATAPDKFLDWRVGLIGSHVGDVNVKILGCSVTEGEQYCLVQIGSESKVRFGNIHLSKEGAAKLVKIQNGIMNIEFEQFGDGFEEDHVLEGWDKSLKVRSTLSREDYAAQIRGITTVSSANVNATESIGFKG